jgi:hypothetical protein
MEQSLIHAFMHWHTGDRDGANAAWTTCGAAMMHLTGLVRVHAALPGMPIPGACPRPRIAGSPAQAHDLDREAARPCSEQAAAAAGMCSHRRIADLCRSIAEYCVDLSQWQPGTPHPAACSNPAAFGSFQLTLEKYVTSPLPIER